MIITKMDKEEIIDLIKNKESSTLEETLKKGKYYSGNKEWMN